VNHTDCTATNACLPDGTCGDDSTVIYVSESGSDTPSSGTCTMLTPCATINKGLSRVTATRNVIKVSGNLTQNVLIDTKRVAIIPDPGTTLTGIADPAVHITMSEVRIYDLSITCSAAIEAIKTEMGSTTTLKRDKISGCKKGIEAKGGYTRIARSTIANN